jgi:hypothetical protein
LDFSTECDGKSSLVGTNVVRYSYTIMTVALLSVITGMEVASQTKHPKEKTMYPEPAKSFAQLSGLAHNYSTGVIPDEYRQSLPIPVRLDSEFAIEYLFVPAHIRPKEPVELFPPAFALTIRADGGFIRLWRVSPRDFGLNHDPNQPIGRFGMPDGWTYENYDRHSARLLETLDTLFPRFTTPDLRSSAETRTAAREFLAEFKQLMEPPLSPYYEAVGKLFFTWVRTAST